MNITASSGWLTVVVVIVVVVVVVCSCVQQVAVEVDAGAK